jgi:hypothetical protein
MKTLLFNDPVSNTLYRLPEHGNSIAKRACIRRDNDVFGEKTKQTVFDKPIYIKMQQDDEH